MKELDRLLAVCLSEISTCEDLKKLDSIKSVIIGKNGKITDVMRKLHNLPDDEKRKLGIEINALKKTVTDTLKAREEELKMLDLEKKLSGEMIDVSMPSCAFQRGKIHPLTKVTEEVFDILSSYGFMFADGPDIESEYLNFTALNLPDHHPARTMHDTFYVNVLADEHGRKLLRTHTSPVQIRSMLLNDPPFRFFTVGRTYRSDYDATHTPMFSQIEGLMVEENASFSHLKWLLSDFLKKFFQVKNLGMRFRPSFFPFTEPSAEVDINYEIKNGNIVFGSGDKWLEVAGCGVVHPNVMKHGKVDAEKFQGIAFGFGLERLVSLKYGIPDLRGYFESTDNWRNSFGFHPVTR